MGFVVISSIHILSILFILASLLVPQIGINRLIKIYILKSESLDNIFHIEENLTYCEKQKSLRRKTNSSQMRFYKITHPYNGCSVRSLPAMRPLSREMTKTIRPSGLKTRLTRCIYRNTFLLFEGSSSHIVSFMSHQFELIKCVYSGQSVK